MLMLGDDTTERRLRLLKAEFTQFERRGGGDGRTATRTESPAPLSLAVLDRIRAAVTEVVEHTRPPPRRRPRPADDTRIYDWARQHTKDLAPEGRQAGEALIYRQGLDHAIAMGVTTVIRQHPCPACGCLGLYWRAGRAACVNHYCVDDDGMSRTWSLARIAREHIARQEAVRARAT
ncbi:hypothetical protein [Streptomyces microflavus]|uniref:hypothetical protein n=1 Tax=Streptomyces microflavus TaxID=1919 RepID=UPI003B226527